MAKTRRPQGVNYKKLIYNAVLGNKGITKDGVVLKIRGARNTIYNNIREMIDDGTLIHKKRGLYINPDNVRPTTDLLVVTPPADIRRKRDNLQNFLKNHREIIRNILPRIEKKAKKSGKPIFYTESAADVIGIDGMTGKPMSGEIPRINEKCKDDLLLIMANVNNVIRAITSLYIIQINPGKEKQEIDNEQKKALKEITKIKRKLLEMTAQGGRTRNSTGVATFQMWWYQLTAGFELKGDNLVWEKTPKNS